MLIFFHFKGGRQVQARIRPCLHRMICLVTPWTRPGRTSRVDGLQLLPSIWEVSQGNQQRTLFKTLVENLDNLHTLSVMSNVKDFSFSSIDYFILQDSSILRTSRYEGTERKLSISSLILATSPPWTKHVCLILLMFCVKREKASYIRLDCIDGSIWFWFCSI